MLQESEGQESEEANDDADVTEYASKMNEDVYKMIIIMVEHQKTLE